jgi:hypothetical protein
MTRWSSSEKNVGVLLKWPKNTDDSPSWWKALHDTVDGARVIMAMLDEVFEDIDRDPDLSPSGRAKRRAEQAASALKELDEYAPLVKAANLTEKRITRVREKVSLLPESPTPTGVDIALATEIRAAVRAEKEPEKFAFGLRGDAKVMQAVLSAPAFLSGMTNEGVERLRAAALESLYPSERAEMEQLTSAEKIAREAVISARNRIAERAGLVKDAAGNWMMASAKPATT